MLKSKMDRGDVVSCTEAKATTGKEVHSCYQYEITPNKKGVRQETDRSNTWNVYLANTRDADITTYRAARLDDIDLRLFYI